MNRTNPDQERAPASEPVWERPWSVEEIRRSSQSWSLAADAGVRDGPGTRGEGGPPGWRAVCERETGAWIPPAYGPPAACRRLGGTRPSSLSGEPGTRERRAVGDGGLSPPTEFTHRGLNAGLPSVFGFLAVALIGSLGHLR
jgi:hypothetical protein